MQAPTRRIMPAFLAVVVLFVTSILVSAAVAEDSIQMVNLAGKFKSCGPDAPPGCEHVMFFGDPQTEAFQKVYRFPKGFVFPKHWHEANENLVMVHGLLALNADGSTERSMKAGDFVRIPAKVVHWGVCTEECVFYLSVDGPDSFNLVEAGK
jgi:quercetin dioxygenase-like cupin family protein